jgi:CBS domain-containing protein
MLVRDLMTPEVPCCLPEENLAEVVARMWSRHCGALPILDGEGGVLGILTDRDICIALGTRDLRASEVRVDEVKPPSVFTCSADADTLEALEIMAAQNIRRLPVMENDQLVGIVSIDDLIRSAAVEPDEGEEQEIAPPAALKQILSARKRPQSNKMSDALVAKIG